MKIELDLLCNSYDYLYLMYKKEPLTFAAKSLFMDLSFYEDYKKAINGK